MTTTVLKFRRFMRRHVGAREGKRGTHLTMFFIVSDFGFPFLEFALIGQTRNVSKIL